MRALISFDGIVSPLVYAVAAPLLLLMQYGVVALCFYLHNLPVPLEQQFWLLPMRELAFLPGLSAVAAASVFAVGFVLTAILASLSFRRANWSGWGHWLSALVIFPGIQIIVVAVLILLPRRRAKSVEQEEARRDHDHLADIMQGILTGVALIVAAVLVSALMLGSYGWGLFVATPFVVGVTTGYMVNRKIAHNRGDTSGYVTTAAALGGLALLLLALEGFLCIVLVAPLALGAAILGGLLGRAVALIWHDPRTPFMSVAVLPVIFLAEAAMPQQSVILLSDQIDIAASPEAVWQAITSDKPFRLPPGFTGKAGLAYPLSGHLLGEGVGATRLGVFSTGVATERVTAWKPGEVLAFTVITQPPAIKEMSPYRTVHAPHIYGYVTTGETRYEMARLTNGKTRLTLRAETMLRVDPILYWEPIARIAFRSNLDRVLKSTKIEAEKRRLTPPAS